MHNLPIGKPDPMLAMLLSSMSENGKPELHFNTMVEFNAAHNVLLVLEGAPIAFSTKVDEAGVIYAIDIFKAVTLIYGEDK